MIRILEMIRAIRQMPRLSIGMFGGELASQHFRYFTMRHPRFPFLGNKVWGVALVPVQGTFQEYMKGKEMQAARTNTNKASAAGFRVCWVDPLAYLEDILDVNRSAPIRQGRPMAEEYHDLEALRTFFQTGGEVLGVLDAEGRLRAYLHLVDGGEVAVISRLLAHSEVMERGVMYLLVTGLMKELLSREECGQNGKWLMYDTLLGASLGLKYFKERLGFKPFVVRWKWVK